MLLRGAIIKEFNKLLKEKRQNFGMMVIDIDNFKHINDRYGHIVGDYALQHLVNILWASQKMECSVGRLGGDEFVVLMKDIKDYTLVDQMSDYIINAIKEPARLDNAWVNLTVSIGIAFFGQHGTTYEDLFYAADIALYEAKRRGKNQYVIYQETLPVLVLFLNNRINRNTKKRHMPLFVACQKTIECVFYPGIIM